ncbi:MAG: hypothetical protein NXH75_05835 [Halobacteriovoraceae bacterium]|nr:hypothetical protein [Halobacteriovoraceae bacterium]
MDNFLSGPSAAAVSGATFGALGTYGDQTVPVTNFRDIITILTISQDPNVQYSLESFFGQNYGDIFPGIERRHYDRL